MGAGPSRKGHRFQQAGGAEVMERADELFDIQKVKDLLVQQKNIMEKLRGHRWFT